MRRKLLSVLLTVALTIGATVSVVPAIEVKAASALTVRCNDVIREVTHCASGSLYGVTETKPGNISDFVTPLKPKVFTNPARAGAGCQQPVGAAIKTAERLSETSGEVMIRLADICPGWPYAYPGMSGWLEKVESVINDKKASSAKNFYGYEIWNEPVYTWKEENGSFNEMWKQTYNLIREKDPGEKIIGPSDGYYNHDRMYSFLQFCKQNNCVPDIVCWHELIGNAPGSFGNDFAATMADLKQIETELGIGDLPVSINEYCDDDHEKEGCPGTSACYIAKFERYKVDSACISWWWTNAPGRLGSLLATDTQKGAGWWFYKWYGDMSGNMVSVTPPNERSAQVDGFACVDSNKKYISLLLGGENDGNINVKFTDLPSWIGSTATVKVEKVDWVNKDTVCEGPYTVMAGNYSVNNGCIDVNLSNCNSTSGYRVYVVPGVSDTQKRYEAEKADITNANIWNSSSASNGQYVGQIDFNDSTQPKYSFVDFTVNVPFDGTYTMAIRYANGSGAVSTQGLAYNGGAWQSVTYPETAGWANFQTVEVSVNLKAGINIIRLAKGSPYYEGGTNYAELDYIEIN